MNELEKARGVISGIDAELAKLFDARMTQVEAIARYKMEMGLPILDAAQESRTLEKNVAFVGNPTVREYYVRFQQSVMDYSKAYQERIMQGMKVAYCGVPGAFAFIAAKRQFPTAQLLSFPTFEETYYACQDGLADAAVLPLENSFAGDVGSVMDLSFSGNLYVNNMVDLGVRQNLLGLPGTRKDDIKTVISHPQALSQCAQYIHDNCLDAQEVANTAVAARLVSSQGDPAVGAIASAEAAELYGLEVLERNINASSNNTTRFVTFSRSRNVPVDSGKMDEHFILVFTVLNEAGALAKTLNIIGSHGFNMCNLRSRPMKELMWNYYFFVELEGNVYSEEGEDLLLQLQTVCDKLKLLGTYKRITFAE